MGSLIYCLGGGGAASGGNTDFYSLNPADNSFTALDSHPVATRNSNLVAHDGTTLLSHSGYTANSTTVPGGVRSWTSGGGWVTVHGSAHAFADSGMASDGNRCYLIGGINASGSLTSQVTTVTVGTGSVESDYLPPIPYATRFVTAFIVDGYLYAVGGADSDSNVADTGYTTAPKNTAAPMFSYRINLTTRGCWEPWSIPLGPRKGAIINYDATNDRLLVAGGLHNGQMTSISDGLAIVPNFTKYFIMNGG
jgi:hypothetical protein